MCHLHGDASVHTCLEADPDLTALHSVMDRTGRSWQGLGPAQCLPSALFPLVESLVSHVLTGLWISHSEMYVSIILACLPNLLLVYAWVPTQLST